MLYLTESEVRTLLPMQDAVRLMRAAFERLARGEAINHPRRRLVLRTQSVLHYMAGSDGRYFGAKLYSTNPKSGAHFSFLLYRAEDGAPLSFMEANYLGQIRTGAASGLATQVMARPSAARLAIIGSGFQARTQVEAMRTVKELKSVKVWSRDREKREKFAAECKAQAVETAEEAVRDADIVVTATNSKEPVIESAWIAPGTHINAMGSNQSKRRELPADLIRRADWIAVDSREQARMESGDLLTAFEELDWDAPRVVELQDVVAGRVPLRTQPDEITIFKSNGLAVEDVVAAGFVYEQALEAALGNPVHS